MVQVTPLKLQPSLKIIVLIVWEFPLPVYHVIFSHVQVTKVGKLPTSSCFNEKFPSLASPDMDGKMKIHSCKLT